VQSSSSPRGARTDAQRAVRYNYLLGRLRDRQITMEEATELFGLMQGMIRAAESARAIAPSGPGESTTRAAPAPEPPSARLPPADDLLAAGILALGAGAGLLAALTKRLNEGGAGGPPAPSAAARRTSPR